MRGATLGIELETPFEEFQLTHPMRGATGIHQVLNVQHNFNSRTPCEVRPLNIAYLANHTTTYRADYKKIQIHTMKNGKNQ